MSVLSYCLAFYRNAGMLAHQYRVWAAYPPELKSHIEILIGDDASPEPAADVPRPDGLPPVRIFRLEDVDNPERPPWRQDAIRNRAAHLATGPWLFLSDMDHVLPEASLRHVLGLLDDGDKVYGFQRLDAPDLTPKRDKQGRLHPHPNTYLMKRERYWMLGGYDEDFCGIYGTDGPYRSKLVATSHCVHLDQVPIIRYPREVIPDASTRTNRDADRQPGLVSRVMSEKAAKGQKPSVLSIHWEMVA